MSEIDQIISDIKGAASAIVGKDVSTLRGFSERQVKALAKQTELVGKGIVSGEIGEDLREFFFDSLEDMALNFVKTLKGLLIVTIEKVWNAVVNVIWAAINRMTGLNLVAP